MLSLASNSICEVCTETYGPHRQPYSLLCGHALCLSCCNGIVQRTSSRQQPTCPFCRENFTSDTVRLIRVDFSPQGRRRAGTLESIDARAPGIKSFDPRNQDRARQLEEKVALVAHRKTSVEEVKSLQRELEMFLRIDQTPSLSLSAALLTAILANHNAHADAIKNHISREEQLRKELADKDQALKLVTSQASRARDNLQGARSELSTRAYTSGNYSSASTSPNSTAPSTPATSPRRASVSAALPPTSPQPYPSTVRSPTTAGRFGQMQGHSRSSSASPSPQPIRRSQTPAPAPSFRSQTPSLRSQTPGPGGVHGGGGFRSGGFSAGLAALSPKRMFTGSVPMSPPMSRSSSDETEHGMYERWTPAKGVAF